MNLPPRQAGRHEGTKAQRAPAAGSIRAEHAGFAEPREANHDAPSTPRPFVPACLGACVPRRSLLTLLLILPVLFTGCGGNSTKNVGLASYYQHDYATARDRLRPLAADRRSENVVLNNMRLGMAALADGDYDEAELALMRAYEYLVSGGVNEADRTVFSTVVYEGVRVWKGDPYEQAMSYYYVAAYHMLIGDWENARAAASNSLFALRDFGDRDRGDQPPDMQQIVTAAERADRRGVDFFNRYRTVESEFALGYLLVGTNYALMGEPEDAAALFEIVRELRPDLENLANRLEAGDYDTLLLVDAGHGPRKEAYGPDNALIRYRPVGFHSPTPLISVAANGRALEHVGTRPVVDLWRLSQYPRWWSLENMRKAKSDIGTVLLGGGLGAAYIGSQVDSREAMYAGLAAAALGAALKGTAGADTRHLEFLPRTVFMVPLTLGPGEHDLSLHIQNDAGSSATWRDMVAGEPGRPAVYYLRAHNAGGRGMPRWSQQSSFSVTPEQLREGDRPWIMGGRDLSPPTEALFDAYQAMGAFEGWTFGAFRDLYRDEGLVFRPGPQGQSGEAGLRPELYRHVVEGGKVLYTPSPGSHLYQRLRRQLHQPYSPRGDKLRNMVQRSEP